MSNKKDLDQMKEIEKPKRVRKLPVDKINISAENAEKNIINEDKLIQKQTAEKTKNTEDKKVEKKKISSENISVNIKNSNSYSSVGKRKRSIVKVRLLKTGPSPKNGITINGKSPQEFFGPRKFYISKLIEPFVKCSLDPSEYNVILNSIGGGLTGVADAAMLGISRALVIMQPGLAQTLRSYKLLTRDSRIVEPKRYGHRKARKKEQYSKR